MFDDAKLQALRQKYGTAKGGEIYDPIYRKVADANFKDGDKRKWPFADVATFIGAPYRPDAQDKPDFGGLDFALIGVPMDLGVTNRAGARLGPRAVRAIERIGPIDHAL
jgi:guanidinopropionase